MFDKNRQEKINPVGWVERVDKFDTTLQTYIKSNIPLYLPKNYSKPPTFAAAGACFGSAFLISADSGT